MTALVDHVRYNNLPSLGEANISRQHRHHIVGDNEAVVKVEGTAHLLDGQAIKDIVSFGNKVVPTTWMAFDGKVLPMEFAVDPAATATPAPTDAFLVDFLSVLALNGLDGLFGIDTIAKGAWTEMSVGDASVVVPSNDGNSYDQDKFIPVAFTFDEENPKFKVHGRCGVDHKHSSKPKPKPK